jgi:NAD-dependent DNA ligase
LSGGNAEPEQSTAAAIRLPLDDPAPHVAFLGMSFVATGQFMYGSRDRVHGCISERGGTPVDNVTKKTHFLVIGALASRDWAHASYGRKIEKAVKYRDEGSPLKIVCEEHWVDFL